MISRKASEVASAVAITAANTGQVIGTTDLTVQESQTSLDGTTVIKYSKGESQTRSKKIKEDSNFYPEIAHFLTKYV